MNNLKITQEDLTYIFKMYNSESVKPDIPEDEKILDKLEERELVMKSPMKPDEFIITETADFLINYLVDEANEFMNRR